MDTYFVEIVMNNKDKSGGGVRFLRCVILARSKQHSEHKALDYFKKYYKAGDNGLFYVQCNWKVSVPTREIIEKKWQAASQALGSTPVSDSRGIQIGERKFRWDTTKKGVLETWDACNCNWDSPTVHYDNMKNGYIVSLHNYMAYPSDFMFFKGNTADIYQKAVDWVEENTFKGDYYRNPF